MAAATPLVIPKESQNGLVQFLKACSQMTAAQWNLREQFRQRDLAYMRELDNTRDNVASKLANRYGDSSKFRNITVPVVLPQVEAAVTYQASVFLTGSPLFGWTAAPDSESLAIQYQAIVEDQAVRGGWVRHLMMAFRDTFKYNLGAVELSWGNEVTAALETDASFGLEAKPKEVIWSGNKLERLDLYNSFWDTRCNPAEVHQHGEFAGYTKLFSRIRLKAFLATLPDKIVTNIRAALESGSTGVATSATSSAAGFYVPFLNPEATALDNYRGSTVDWLSWAGMSPKQDSAIAYRDLYEVTTLYARILPSDFNLKVPAPNTPQVWKFIFVNREVLIYAERQTNAHNYLPILFMQANEDGLAYQTKSLADNAKPFQDVGTALVNSAIAARRRAISDRGIFDPSMILESHINNDSPTAKIPLRPSAYGKGAGAAYTPIPFRDDQSSVIFQELQQVFGMAETVNGQNRARQGQFVKGNKTQHEFQTVMANANGRDQVTSMMLESQFFTPLKEMIRINILQYQTSAPVYSAQRQQNVQIDPVQLRQQALQFKLTDGLTPTDKIMSADEFQVALQTLSSSPALSSQYNLAPAFTYLFKTRNVDLKPFEKSPQQLAYEQAMQQWQQAASQVAELAKSVTMKVDGITFQQVQELVKSMLPPQPTPQQFGYQPPGTDVPQKSAQSKPVQQLSNGLTNT